MAELLKANYNKIKPEKGLVILKNYYEDNFPEMKIPLKTDKTVQENVERYFKKYRKAKSGKSKIKYQIQKTKKEIEELSKELFDIQELDDYKLLKKVNKKPKKSTVKQKKSYKKIYVNQDWEIFIGRTSKENDVLTTRFAKPNDWWFHTRVFKGTHIILRNYKKQEIPDFLKIVCCRLAAYFSKAKNSKNVPVDYTQIRYVTKPKGAAPGFVIYKKFKTLYVDPISMRQAAKEVENYEKS